MVVEVEQKLRASGELISNNDMNTWRAMPIQPSRSRKHESRVIENLGLVIQSIIREVALVTKFDPELVFQPANINPQGRTAKPDGGFSIPSPAEMTTLSNSKAGVPWWGQVLLSSEFKKEDNEEDLNNVRGLRPFLRT